MLTSEQYDALVHRVEALAREHPRRYQTRVAVLAVLGYAYVWAVLAVCVGLVALLVWLFLSTRSGAAAIGKLAIALVILIVAVLRALWVRFPPPQGVRLTQRDAPALFALLRELTTALNAPAFHHVVVTDDFNAAVMQRPLLGPLGWYHSYLLLGLPLMLTLSAEEFRAVLAHELGHLSRQHGRFGAWIYRVRMTWARIVQRLEEEQHWGRQAFEWFLNLWAPYFNAYSFVLARAQEYEADRFAADLAGAEHLVRALVTMEVRGAQLEQEFWPGVFRTAARHPQAPEGVLNSLGQVVAAGPAPERGRRWLAAALNRRTGTDDTHPSLTDRMRALHVTAHELRPLMPPSAAEHYFGVALRSLTGQVEVRWREMVADGWRVKHLTDAASERRLERLDAQAASAGRLDREAAGERAELTLQLRGADAGIEPLRQLLAVDGGNVLGNWALGQILLDRGEEEGVGHIERAIAGNPAMRAEGYERLRAWYEEQGRNVEAEQYRRRVWEQTDQLERAAPERRDVKPGDRLLPHALSEEDLAPVREALAPRGNLTEAYLVRKAVTHLPDVPFYVLGVKFRLPWHRYQSSEKEQELVEEVAREVQLPGDWLVVSLNGQRARIRKKMRKVPGAQLVGR